MLSVHQFEIMYLKRVAHETKHHSETLVSSSIGGPRMRAKDIKLLYKVNRCYQLTQIDKGNHFVTNFKHATGALKHFGDTSNQLILEIGSGPGAMTRRLLSQPSLGVLGVERDTSYNAYLENIHKSTNGKFRWVNADVMNADEATLVRNNFPECQWGGSWDDTPMVNTVVNITFASVHNLIIRYCIDVSRRKGIFKLGRIPMRFVMEQKIAERVAAPTGTKEFSVLSPLVQNYFSSHIERTLSGLSFYPFTRVDCAILTLRPRSVPLVEVDGAALFQFLRFIVHKRHQESIQKALSRAMPVEIASYICREAAVDETLPMWKLTVVDLCRMASLWVMFLKSSNQQIPKSETW